MDFRGWNSSYTGEPIPLEEMVEWRSATVDRIMSLRPRRVLEIGAGSGLVLSQIAPHCEQLCRHRHVGGGHRKPAPARWSELQIPWRDRVELLAQPAHVTEGLPRGHFDTIIVNSVVQYFPNAGYLADVIDNAMELLAPGGAVFIGDVRNHTLQGAFQTAIALARTPDAARRRDPSAGSPRHARRTRIALGARVFHQRAPPTSRRWPDSTSKSNADLGDNELNRYRYDVVIHKTPAPVRSLATHPPGRGRNAQACAGCVPGWISERPAAVRITDIPRPG